MVIFVLRAPVLGEACGRVMDKSIVKKYNYWQWRTLIILMIGYMLFYFVRKNFSIVMPALESELGITKTSLGLFLTLFGVVYGVSRFLNGFMADRVSKRKMMAIGLGLSALTNIIIGLSTTMNGIFSFLGPDGKATPALIVFIGSLWLINGFTSGMGYPPCGSLMAIWIKPSELATKQSIWNSSHSIGAGLVALLVGFILNKFTYSAWQWCFFVPAMLAIFGALLLWFGLKDSPAEVGLPDPETIDENAPVKEVVNESAEFKTKAYNRLVKDMVFRNPLIWIFAVTNFFVYIIRFVILDWGSTILTQDGGFSISTASSVVAASEIAGGIIGTLLGGWATDRIFKGKAHRTCLVGLVAATAFFGLFWFFMGRLPWLAIVCVVMTSFFIYMPQALLGIACSNQATKRVAASANGIAGIFGYASTVVSGLVFGMVADNLGWNSVFEIVIACGVVGSIIIATIWKAPANGYEKANKILDTLRAEESA